ncbi:MAG: response regulator [Chlorobiaceae bacterium]|nr:response regulator [Chlorobiaceae bacterium]
MIGYIKSCPEKGTQVSRFNLQAIALLGAPAHFIFYFLFRYGFELPYENVYLRGIAVLICGSVLFKDSFPSFLKRHFMAYWHFGLIFVLPFIFTVNLFETNFHELWLYWELFMVFVLISFVPNWFMFLVDLLIGVVGAIVFSILFSPHLVLQPHFNIPLYSIVLFFTIVVGYLFSYSNRQGQKAQERNNALQALAGGIAHEMRNPLGQISYNFDAIQQELPFYNYGTVDSVIPVSGLERIYQRVAQGQMAVSRGVQIIEMILEEVKDDASSLKSAFACFSISALTHKALDEYSYELEEEREKVHFDDTQDFMFRGAENMYVFVIFNLILNALYFLRSFPEGRIDIHLQPGETLNRVFVRDDGPGVSAENIGKLFDPFFTSGRKGGTGLGLAFCKRVMHSFGGDITCNSVHGEYTEFVLSLPVLAESEIAEYEVKLYTDSRGYLSGKRILLADDDPETLAMIRRYLLPLGVDIEDAVSGSEVMAMIESERYDLLLADLDLPVIDAFEIAYRIRGGGKYLPIVAYTKEPSYMLQGRAEKSGIHGLLSLPLRLPDFLQALTSSIKENPAILQGSLAGKTLLVVDDSAVNRMIIRNMLQKFHLTIVEAVNGREALDTLENHHCDLILMDMQMPVMDGLETAKRIRSGQWEFRNVPIIGMSGDSDPATVQKAMLNGMNDYLVKPVENKLLLKKVAALFR